MKKFLKDKRPLLGLASLLILGGIGVTLAYYSDTTIFRDSNLSGSFSVRTVHDFYSTGTITPGEEIEKVYQTTNTGSLSTAVRYFYIAQWVGPDNLPVPLGFTYETETDGIAETHTELGMTVQPSLMKDALGANGRRYWSDAFVETIYCADQTVITDPEHYTCNEPTEDITQAYSVISGPYNYYEALRPNQTTASSPFTSIRMNNNLLRLREKTRKVCYYDEYVDVEEACSIDAFHYEDNPNVMDILDTYTSISGHERIVSETSFSHPYLDAQYHFMVRAESIEAPWAMAIWNGQIELPGYYRF